MEHEKRGLTPAGVAVVVCACVGLIALPFLFWGMNSLRTSFSGHLHSPPPAPVTNLLVSKTLKRMGKDVKVSLALTNTPANVPVDAVTIKMKIDGSSSGEQTIKTGPVAGSGKQVSVLVFKDVPKRNINDYSISIDYTYAGGSGTSMEAGAEVIK